MFLSKCKGCFVHMLLVAHRAAHTFDVQNLPAQMRHYSQGFSPREEDKDKEGIKVYLEYNRGLREKWCEEEEVSSSYERVIDRDAQRLCNSLFAYFC